jgi:hypothetical protein
MTVDFRNSPDIQSLSLSSIGAFADNAGGKGNVSNHSNAAAPLS